MMVTLLVYAYSVGVCSSRKIAAACERNLAFRAIVGDEPPDFRTISDFRRIHTAAFGPLFLEVPRLAGKLGMVKLGNLSTDGTKIRANASRHKAMSYGYMTHICGRTREGGGFIVKRQTVTKRLRAKLSEVKQELAQRRHEPIPKQGKWLRGVVQGYFNYHAVPGNTAALEAFRTQTVRSWLRTLRRRSQRHRMTWKRFRRHVDRWIPLPKILHPYPNERFFAKHPR
jgi:RNA-directed DNA polymerase